MSSNTKITGMKRKHKQAKLGRRNKKERAKACSYPFPIHPEKATAMAKPHSKVLPRQVERPDSARKAVAVVVPEASAMVAKPPVKRPPARATTVAEKAPEAAGAVADKPPARRRPSPPRKAAVAEAPEAGGANGKPPARRPQPGSRTAPKKKDGEGKE